MRLFVAIEAAEPWRIAALEARRAVEHGLAPEHARALRWVAPDLLHVTLSFLGEVEAARLDSLRAALDEVAPRAPLSLHTAGLGSFGRPDRLRVVWLTLEGDTTELEALARRVDQEARAAAGLDPPRAPSTPHLTLARVRDRAGRDARLAIARAVAAAARTLEPSVPVAVPRIALVRSHLEARGPRYEVLSRHGGSTDDREAGREVDASQAGA